MDPVTDEPIEQITEIATTLLGRSEALLDGLMRPWNAYQIAILLVLFAAVHLVGAVLRPWFHEWLRSRDGWPKWRLRLGLVIHRRLQMILYVVGLWAIVWIMREITWPSRSYLLAIVANLVTAWLLIAFATRLISNGLVRGLVRYGAWAWVTLSILNLTTETQSLLDGLAVTIGDTRFSVWIVVQAIAILTILIAAARFIATTSTARIRSNSEVSRSMQELAIKFLQLILYGSAFFIGLNIVGVDLTGLAVLSGAIGVGLGFGLQKVVSNLVSGVIILLDKSVKPGDVISLGDTFGWINSLGARYVSINTRDGKEYLIPNEDLITGQVVNWSHSNDYVRIDLFFGTAYDDDPHKVRDIAINAAMNTSRVLSWKKPVCHIVGFGDSSVDYILRFWIEDPVEGLTNIRGNVYLALWDAFKENGISIPFPQREVRMLKGSELDTRTLD